MQEVLKPKEDGQSLVEFAVSVVVLLIILVGIVDLARALYTYMALRDAAEEGALVGSMYPEDLDAIRQRVINNSSLVNGLGLGGDDITVVLAGPPCAGSLITVEVVYSNFELTMPFLGTLIGTQTLEISADVSATIIYPYACP